jgi:hypothetical protein
MHKKMRGLLVFILFVGCSTAPKDPHSIHFNLKEVLPYSFELEKTSPFLAPYVAVFHSGRKTLTYVAAAHLSIKEFPNVFDSPVFRTVDSVYQRESPQVVIVEGIHTADELSPPSLKRHADECRKTKYLVNCGEPFYAINQAIDHGSAYIAGEPDESFVVQQVTEAGYTVQDLISFYLIREIPQLKRQNGFNLATFPKWAEKRLAEIRRDLKFGDAFGYEDFKRWYANHMSKSKNFKDIEADDTAPDAGPQSTFAQKISHQVNIARDRSVVLVAEHMLNRFDRVLIVFGASHLLVQEPVFSAVMGKPKYEKLFGGDSKRAQ